MDLLKTRLDAEDVRGTVMSAKGEIKDFHRKGIIDLFVMVTETPEFLRGGKIADRVIGKGAAFLLLKAGIDEVYAYVISEPALALLQHNNIKVSYVKLLPHIINRTGDGICPVEMLTEQVTSPDVAYAKIKEFLKHIPHS